MRRPQSQSLISATRKARVLGLCLLVGVWLWSSALFAQEQGVSIGVEEGNELTPVESDPESVSFTFPKLLRDTEYYSQSIFNPLRFSGSDEVKIGENGGGAFVNGSLYSSQFRLPLIHRATVPEFPTVKAGRFFGKVAFVSGSALYSDNIDLSTNDRDDGGVAIVRMGVVGMLQITDTLQLNAAGTVIYLPLRNKIGIAGFGVGDIFADFDLLTRAQAVYNFTAGEWELQLFDVFDITREHVLSYETSSYTGEVYTEVDQAGRYYFRDRTPLDFGARGRGDDYFGSNYDFFKLRNLAGASASRMLPTETRVQAGIEHANYWYEDADDNLRLPNSRDELSFFAQSERESMRFQPFFSYRAYRYNFDDNLNHTVRGGIVGPATENLRLFADGGYFWSDNHIRSSSVGSAGLLHQMNPLTAHGAEFRQLITEPVRAVEQSYIYNIQRVLGPYMVGSAFAAHSTYDGLEVGAVDSSENRFGGRIVYNLGLRTTLRTSLTYSDYHINNLTDDHVEIWRPRAELVYRFQRGLDLLLTYQYQNVSSTVTDGSYRENLVIVTITKYF